MRGVEVGEEETLQLHTVHLGTPHGSCTAAIIERDILITAAHCVMNKPDPSRLEVGFGIEGDSVGRSVSAYIIHPGFRGPGEKDDIALLLLRNPVPSGYSPVPVHMKRLPRGAKVVAAGYGRNKADKASEPLLRRTTLTIVGFEGREAVLEGPGGWGTCLGDSGGPSYVWKNGKLELFGVISRGESASCKGIEVHGIVAAHRHWIAEAIRDLRDVPN